MGGQQPHQHLQQVIQINTGILTLEQKKIQQEAEQLLVVTLLSKHTFSDGTTTVSPLQAADVGASGSTTIDGGRITTGTVAAGRISISGKNISDLSNDSGFQGNTATRTGGTVGGWSLSSTTITSGNITLDNANTRIVISD